MEFSIIKLCKSFREVLDYGKNIKVFYKEHKTEKMKDKYMIKNNKKLIEILLYNIILGY